MNDFEGALKRANFDRSGELKSKIAGRLSPVTELSPDELELAVGGGAGRDNGGAGILCPVCLSNFEVSPLIGDAPPVCPKCGYSGF